MGSIFGGGARGLKSKELRPDPQRNTCVMDIQLIAPQATKRLMKDIRNAQEELMKQQGIWYWMDESNMTKGYALLKGPEDTPYDGCLLMFSIQFPSDYPFSPPKVVFLTSDGKTRFHPNLYVEGKVCLSILGTFPGPSWSGTQSLNSILISILGLLDTNPLAHEPAYTNGSLVDARHRDYADFVEHQMIQLMIGSIQKFEQKAEGHLWFPFEEEVRAILTSLKERLKNKVLEKANHPECLWGGVVYGMSGRSYWKRLAKEIPWIAPA